MAFGIGIGISPLLTDLSSGKGGIPPLNLISPALSGTAQEGQTLTCSTGTWSGSPTYAYQWKRNGNNIGSATNSTYTLVTADVGQSIKCTVTATNILGSANADSNTVTPTAAVDPDAQAFITAASITDPTQQSAINNLVIGLKADGLWTKMQAIYPMVGGTNSQHTWNLKNTAQFQISWQGGVTSSSNGVQFNGMNSYGITGLIPSTSLTLNNGSLSYYSRTNSNNLGIEIAARMSSPSGSDLSLGIFGATPLTGRINTFADAASLTVSDTLGLYQITRTGGSTQKVFKNTLSNLGNITTSTPAVNIPIYIGCMNNSGVAAFYSNRECAFASIGDGLLDSEANNLYLCVQQFNTTLGRQV